MVPLEYAWIRTVISYKGHKAFPQLGPYADFPKQIAMFESLNHYRKKLGRPEWKVHAISGEKLIEALQEEDPVSTLLVLPAGPSSHFEEAFSQEQIEFIRREFLKKNGGRLFATCGSSYMVSKWREFQSSPNEMPFIKKSVFPLFKGAAKGPLCLSQSGSYNVSFYSDVVTVASEKETCRMYLSGGGSFFPNENDVKTQIVATYLDSELIRLGKTACSKNAAIISRVGRGAVLLSMFHPEYGPEHIDIKAQELAFPESDTNWEEIKGNLSSTDCRMRFVLQYMFFPLEAAASRGFSDLLTPGKTRD